MRPQVPGQVMIPAPVVTTAPVLLTPDNTLAPPETRSWQEAAGSDRRDVDMMGPPGGVRAPPPPTPGRDIAGEESGAGSGGSVFRRDTRDHYESTDDRDARDSDSGGEGDRYGGSRRQRGGSPGSRSGHQRSARINDRSYRSSTDREDERRYGGGRRDQERKHNKRADRDHR